LTCSLSNYCGLHAYVARVIADVDVGVVAVQSGHKLRQLDTSSLLACEHCMVADHALRDIWVSLSTGCFTICML